MSRSESIEAWTLSTLNHTCQIRSYTHKGMRLWVAKDLTEVLGVGRLRLEAFEDYEVCNEKLPAPSNGGFQNNTMLTDFGLFRVLYTSRSTKASEIRRHVFHCINNWVNEDKPASSEKPEESPEEIAQFVINTIVSKAVEEAEIDELTSVIQRLDFD